jgi:PAS domain S-box-containing protein
MLGRLNRNSLKFQLVVTVSSLAVVSGVLFSAVVSQLTRQQIERDQSSLLNHVAARLAGRLAQDLNARAREMLFLSRLDQLHDRHADKDIQLALLQRMQASYAYYAWLGITDAQGIIVTSTVPELRGLSVAQRQWFVAGSKGLYFGDAHGAQLLSEFLPPARDPSKPLRLVDVTAPVFDERGGLVGVAAAHLNLEWALETRLSMLEQLNRPDIELLVVNAQGQVLLGTDQLPAEQTFLGSLDALRRTKSTDVALVETWPDGERYLTAAVSSPALSLYPGLGWTVVARIPEHLAFASAYRLQQMLAWGGLISAVLFGLLLWVMVGRQLRPLERLSAAAQKMQHHELALARPLPEPKGEGEVAQFTRSLASLVNALHDSQERFRRLFQLAPVPMGHIGNDGRILAQNVRFTEVFGYTLQDMHSLNDWWRHGFPDPDQREQARQTWSTTVDQARRDGAQIETREFRVHCKDGSERLVTLSGIVLDDGVLTAFHDVTQQRLAEAELRLWAASFEQAELGLTISNARTNRLLAVNPAFARERGYSREEMVDLPTEALYPAELRGGMQSMVSTLEQSNHGLFETEHITRDGRRFPVLLDMSVLRDHKGQPVRRVTYALDLTERRRTEQALARAQANALEQQRQAQATTLQQLKAIQQARHSAEAAELEVRRLNTELEQRVVERTAALSAAVRELDSFAYTVSHDLRAPVRTMKGFADILLNEYKDRLDDDTRDCVQRIEQAGVRMSELIEGILTLSGIARGGLRNDTVDLSALATRGLGELAQVQPHRRVKVNVEPGLSAQGDPRMLDVLVTNLLDNAWKYTSKTAEAQIRVYAGEVNGRPGFCVSDNGVGFDMAQAVRLFEPFQRLHRQDDFPGTGVGLATVQRIVQRHGGELCVQASSGQGACFCFTLPGAPVGPSNHTPAPVAPAASPPQ